MIINFFHFILVVLISMYPAAALAKTLLVPKKYPNISQAMKEAEANDIVRVAAGTYSENVIMRPGVTLEGGWDAAFHRRDPSQHNTIINGSARGGYAVLGADKAVLDGFFITGGKPPMMMPDLDVGPGVYCDSIALTVRNSIITGNHTAGIYARNCQLTASSNIIAANGRAGIFLEESSAAVITGNLITRNLWAGINVGGQLPSKVEIANNAVHSNTKAGINVAFAQGAVSNNLIYKNGEAGIRCGLAPMEIINNTIADNGLAGVSMAESAGLTAAAPSDTSEKSEKKETSDKPTLPLIKNNIIAGNGQAGIRSFGSGYTYNLLYANNRVEGFHPDYLWYIRRQLGGYEDQASFVQTKNILADPLFVNPAQHDYHLRPGSPAIDQGDPDPQFNDKHFGPSLGADRNDLGAYGGPGAVAETRPPNQAPEANIEPLKEQVYAGDKVVLNGSVSRDPNGDAIDYQWRLIQKPRQSRAVLHTEKDGACVFTADKGGRYTLRLRVVDRWGLQSRPITFRVNVDPDKPPTAKISKPMGPVKLGEAVKLSSFDKNKQNGKELTFSWFILKRPTSSQAILDDPKAERPSFTPDAPGCYTMQLTVSNGKKSSQPSTVHICTQESQVPGRRVVPDEYPTIQAAIDAAEAGEDIIVQSGTYREHLIVDKPVNLIGVGMPVIDGGNKKGDEAAVFICYLDNTAQGRFQGFTVTGGGAGQYGHGIQILNSSPEVVGNLITGNKHVGVGIHGQYKFTKDAKIHDNVIRDNAIGVSNGLGAGGTIYNNAIYNNKETGIGVRGLASPVIRNNKLYGNYIGIGVREEGYPLIESNIIQDNIVGIAVNPGAAGATYAKQDKITVRNNQILSNRQCGIFISSLNKSDFTVRNNTIRDNSAAAEGEGRTGGIVTGYPHESLIKVFLRRNRISGNNGRNIQLYKELGESAGMRGSSAGRRPDFGTM